MICLTQTSIHANLVFIHGIGVLIMGPSGSGKSALSYQLIQEGGKLISDDLVVFDLNKKPQLYGYSLNPGQIYLRAQKNIISLEPHQFIDSNPNKTYPIHLLISLRNQ